MLFFCPRGYPHGVKSVMELPPRPLYAALYVVWLAALAALAGPAEAAQSKNVVFVTLDGVRRTDFHDKRLFPWFWKHASRGGAFGDIRVSNRFRVSLPGYQSILAGKVQPCRGNRCGRIRTETMLERVSRELNGRREDVAIVASWLPLALAAEHRPGAVYVAAGLRAPEGERDPLLRRIARAGKRRRPPWRRARWDKFTFEYGKRFLKRYRPRLLMMSFLDSDKWAHRRDGRRHKKTLRRYDRWLRELFALLKKLGRYGEETTVVLTTDHGRGGGRHWPRHGLRFPNSRFVWLYGRGPCTEAGTRLLSDQHSHIDIRPTIERLLGLVPRRCKGCGDAIPQLASCARATLPRQAAETARGMGPGGRMRVSANR